MPDHTPVIIGVGEASERIGAEGYAALSPADLAGRAAAAAVADAGAGADLAAHIDLIASVRQFETSHERATAPFGRADNFPRAVARRIGANPARAILEPVGGQGPQHLVNELAQEIGAGRLGMALICGAEAISTQRDLMSRGETRDWSETVGGQIEDRGYGEELLTPELYRHGARAPISVYALFENARRGRLGLDREAYGHLMGELFAPFTQVAAGNPHAMSREVFTADEIATVTGPNRLICDPFPRRVVARDQANQGAAVLIASADRARELGVPESRFVYLLGGADARERTPIERQDLSTGPASILAARQALETAGMTIDEIDLFDLYSCFPIAVFNVRDALGIKPDDPRPLTVTGGLPFFGGAGNNYSMHAIAAMVRALRADPRAKGFVAANGGYLSKYSVGIYSATPAPWKPFDSKAIQAEINAWPAPAIAPGEGTGTVETYTIDYGARPPLGVVVGRLESGARFVSMTPDPALVHTMVAHEPLGAKVTMSVGQDGKSVISAIEPVS